MSDCKKYSGMINAYLDHALDEKQERDFLLHIKKCEACRKELELMQEILKDLGQMDLVEPPKDFSAQLHQRLLEETKAPEKKVLPFYKNWRTYSSLAAVLLFAFVLKTGLVDERPFEQQIVQQQPPVITSSDEVNMQAKSNDQNDAQITGEARDEAQPPQQSYSDQTRDISKPVAKATSVPQNQEQGNKSSPSMQPVETPLPSVNTTSPEPEQNTAVEDPAKDPRNQLGGDPNTATQGGGQVDPTVQPTQVPETVPSAEPGNTGAGSVDNVDEQDNTSNYRKAEVLVQEMDLEKAKECFSDEAYTPEQIRSALEEKNIPYFLQQQLEEEALYQVVIKVKK